MLFNKELWGRKPRGRIGYKENLGSQLAHVGEIKMKLRELIMRMILATRLIIPYLAIVATINALKSAWETGILFFSAFVGILAISLVMYFVGILVIMKER